ncbi:MAG: SDH family Clp fold serine proteinase [Limisphaerales bacterium]
MDPELRSRERGGGHLLIFLSEAFSRIISTTRLGIDGTQASATRTWLSRKSTFSMLPSWGSFNWLSAPRTMNSLQIIPAKIVIRSCRGPTIWGGRTRNMGGCCRIAARASEFFFFTTMVFLCLRLTGIAPKMWNMGVYTEYLDRNLDFTRLQAERKKQLITISQLRDGRDILVIAADLTKPNSYLDYTDILPVQDQLANLSGNAIDIIIETPDGFAEAAEDIISLIRGKYERVGMIVPGWAKSAGTIFVMAGDEILMGKGSALGPIDGQIAQPNGKRFSAHSFLEGLTRIKGEADSTGILSKAYIPILQNISPGEIQAAENAQAFSQKLVRDWLEQYKFKFWNQRRTSGIAVTQEYKKERAESIAGKLADQSRWLTHNRSIRIPQLENDLNLQITDYSQNPALNEAIFRYYTLLRMTFDLNFFKLFETPTTQIYRFPGIQEMPVPIRLPIAPPGSPFPGSPVPGTPPPATQIQLALNCNKCKTQVQVVANLDVSAPIPPGCLAFPADNVLKCPSCGADINMMSIRLQLEAQTGKKII